MNDTHKFTARLNANTDVGGLVVVAGEYSVFPIIGFDTQEVVSACLFHLGGFDSSQIDLSGEQYATLRPALTRI